MSFICGSFRSQQEEDDYDVLWPSTPKKPTRRRQIFGSRRGKNATNPYSDRGLDKFEALLADLDKKRQKILTQKGAEDVSMVKFIFSGPNEVQPIVVKFRDQRKHDDMSLPSTKELDLPKNDAFVKAKSGGNEAEEDYTKPSVDQCKRKFGEWWKPSYYLPLFVILILVFLMFFGRSFTILCTSIGWYLVPIFNAIIDKSKQPNIITKKEHLKRSRLKTAHKQ
ncbi:hypothetical protein HanRHA438_Chr09g0415471 [Helianthus annuus]|uniref:ZCF37 n=1 Tax=Helianthus annuus TaxID=4232 RepID=A0A251TZ12_HELAN|nr:uncharacterized protein LOC110879356 [Helianthus annuus]KAF5792219.1 hypothetical protein HanXRQr2_Chr09g0403581 [Helianthus annuus]KAJ0543590.1 hypothetical protein HanHA89_Chr09g0352331 [Helianthus annuus]KAJ0630187.1 hypothetical protein HanHA300_Chr00c0427g0763531 [Helianthus annuus]KAJ0708644.1 hypothetical protein HanLR1_Chr09g0331641 [Helianthus annuus]KAJ0889677.1 hypothetical protein HanRHA438_Chr09g0415471 [Helianthus annuus]